MSAAVASKKKTQQTQGVENLLRQVLDVAREPISDEYSDNALKLIEKLVVYIHKTELPIFAEFCTENSIFEDFFFTVFSTNPAVKILIKLLEEKKRAALERKIYSGELNATIGAHLMKAWREDKPPEIDRKHRAISISDFDELGLPEGHVKIIHEALLQLSIRKKMSVEFRLP